jgi:hypothetical protein
MPSDAHADAAHPPLSVAITTIGVMAIAMVGSSISSQLVDLDIADIAGAFSVSADQASWIACAATMAEVAGIPIAAILARDEMRLAGHPDSVPEIDVCTGIE